MADDDAVQSGSDADEHDDAEAPPAPAGKGASGASKRPPKAKPAKGKGMLINLAHTRYPVGWLPWLPWLLWDRAARPAHNDVGPAAQ